MLEPGQLSTGTREQLYLAIRLAYVLNYCNRAESLPVIMDDVLANFDDDPAHGKPCAGWANSPPAFRLSCLHAILTW